MKVDMIKEGFCSLSDYKFGRRKQELRQDLSILKKMPSVIFKVRSF